MLTTTLNTRYRKLRMEALESRLALTGLPVDSGSLVDYLAETVEMGPVADPAVMDDVNCAVPMLDTAEVATDIVSPGPLEPTVVDSALIDLQGEGEGPGMILNPLPTFLTSFTADHVDGGLVRLSGTISGTNTAGMMIYFGGLFGAQMTTCDAYGYFSHYVPDPGISGFVVAYSPVAMNFLTAYLD